MSTSLHIFHVHSLSMNLAVGCIVQLTGPARNVHNFLSQRGLSIISFPQFTEVFISLQAHLQLGYTETYCYVIMLQYSPQHT